MAEGGDGGARNGYICGRWRGGRGEVCSRGGRAFGGTFRSKSRRGRIRGEGFFGVGGAGGEGGGLAGPRLCGCMYAHRHFWSSGAAHALVARAAGQGGEGGPRTRGRFSSPPRIRGFFQKPIDVGAERGYTYILIDTGAIWRPCGESRRRLRVGFYERGWGVFDTYR